MPIWERLLESAAGVLLLVLLLGIALIVRRRWLTRAGGTFEQTVDAGRVHRSIGRRPAAAASPKSTSARPPSASASFP